MDSTSLGSIVRMLSRGTPSIRISGLVTLVVPAPRRYNVASSTPGWPPVDWVEARPEIRPANALDRLAEVLFLMSLALTEETEPVTETFFCTP